MDIQLPKIEVDPSKITTIYGVLVVAFLVIGYWLYRAGGAGERIVAGVLLLLVALIAASIERKKSEAISPHGMGAIAPATEEVTAKQIAEVTAKQDAATPAEDYVGPDRSYVINRPPDGWSIREMSLAEWIDESYGFSNRKAQKPAAAAAGPREVVIIEPPESSCPVTPIPGKTIIDGVKVPTALEIQVVTQLAIIPMDRAQAPMFAERPFVHNFFFNTSYIFQGGVMTLYQESRLRIPSTSREQLSAEFRQDVQDCTSNGEPVAHLTYTFLFIGIEGDVRDYLLLAKYPALRGENDSRLKGNRQVIESLINSFRPLKVYNSEERLQEMRAYAEQRREQQSQQMAPMWFNNEFRVYLQRVKHLNLDDPDDRFKAMKQAKPFQDLANLANIHNFYGQNLADLWDSLQQAEQGDASQFKAVLRRLVAQAEAPAAAGAAPAAPAADPANAASPSA